MTDRCSFCGKGVPEIFGLHAGLDAQICDECIEICASIVSGRRKTPPRASQTAGDPTDEKSEEGRCSFCRCSAADAETLIGGPVVFICDACVDMGMPILNRRPNANHRRDGERSAGDEDSPLVICNFCGRTQDEALFLVKGEAAAICAECIELTGYMFDGLPDRGSGERLSEDDTPCSFCRKPAKKVRGLVGGMNCHICDECHKVCSEIAALRKS